MKIYSYRPPRIRPAEVEAITHKRQRTKLLIPVFFIIGALVGIYHLPSQELISAVISSENTLSNTAPAIIQQEDPLVEIKPFLKVSDGQWRIQDATPQQAIGGGPGILKDALDLKAAMSVNFDTGEVYYSHNAATRIRIASITKIMTAMTAMDLISMDEKITVEQAATEVEPTVIGVRTGDQLTVRELIKAGLLTSGNDAMAVLAQGVGKKYGGDEQLFIAAMNEKSRKIGMKNTQFDNPQGYDGPNHFSTAEDVVFMSQYALKNYPEIARIVSKKEDLLKANATHKSFNLPNWNMLIGTYPGADGIKIGNTGEAKQTTVASATRQGKRIIAVVLGADGILKRDLSAAELLNVGFARLNITPFHVSEDLLRARIDEWYK